MLEKLFGGDSDIAVGRALDAASLRHQVIANNLANVNTPGFKRQEVRFESDLQSALKRSASCAPDASDAVAAVHPVVSSVSETSQRADGNNVDVESEMVKLATNSMNYQVLAELVGGNFAGLKAAITSGGA